jgi:hypothetical protein
MLWAGLLMGAVSCASDPSAPTCFIPGEVPDSALFGGKWVSLVVPPSVAATTRPGPPIDFVVYEFQRDGRTIGAMYLGNAPGAFDWPEATTESKDMLNGRTATTRAGRTPEGASRQTLVDLSHYKLSASGQVIGTYTHWPNRAHLWYRGLALEDAQIMDGIIASIRTACSR